MISFPNIERKKRAKTALLGGLFQAGSLKELERVPRYPCTCKSYVRSGGPKVLKDSPALNLD